MSNERVMEDFHDLVVKYGYSLTWDIVTECLPEIAVLAASVGDAMWQQATAESKAGCQARVERIFWEMENHFLEIRKGLILPEHSDIWWQALKQKEGVSE